MRGQLHCQRRSLPKQVYACTHTPAPWEHVLHMSMYCTLCIHALGNCIVKLIRPHNHKRIDDNNLDMHIDTTAKVRETQLRVSVNSPLKLT